MLEVKKGPFHFYLNRCSIAPDVIVSLCFNAKLNACVLANFGVCTGCCNSSKDSVPENLELTCLCYALYLQIKSVLVGEPSLVKKSKVSDVSCNISGDRFTITWNTKNNLSSVGSTLLKVIKKLEPSKLYSIYSKIISNLGFSPKRDVFDYTANLLISNLDKDICVCAIGNVKETPEIKAKMTEIIQKLNDNFNPEKADKGTQPLKGVSCDHSKFAFISYAKDTPWSLAVLNNFLSNKFKGMNISNQNSGILLAVKKDVFDNKTQALKTDIENYIDSKYYKLHENGVLNSILAYMLLNDNITSCCDVYELLKTDPSLTSIKSAVKKLL